MAFMEWDDTFRVANTLLDGQHQQLVGMVNEMYQQFQDCKTLEEESALTTTFLEKMEKYAEIHFATEEKLLKQHAYPHLLEHQTLHRQFSLRLEELRRQQAKGVPALSFEMFTLTRQWIAEHIKQADQQYIPYLSGKE